MNYQKGLAAIWMIALLIIVITGGRLLVFEPEPSTTNSYLNDRIANSASISLSIRSDYSSANERAKYERAISNYY